MFRSLSAFGVSNSTCKAWAFASLLEKQLVTFTCIIDGCISDKKAERDCLGVKGASGTKLCISCQNCVRVDEEKLPDDSPMVNYSCTDMSKFIPHAVESEQEVLEGLRIARGMSVAQFKIAEQSVGCQLK